MGKKRIHPQENNGPRIVAIGGGTGLSTMLRGLKKHTKNLTAIVTMADDGGSSGMLRADLGMPPPGDVRHCMQALANVEPLMADLINYRFQEGSLAGQNFGNLFIAALMGITGSFDAAVTSMSKVLALTGRVIPVTCDVVQLVAEFENGTQVVGESKICDFKKAQDCRITQVRMEPANAKVNPQALEAIAQADLILLGPGSLYTSVIPNLLVSGIAQTIADSPALRIYVCNVMTQDGETEGLTASDHLKAVLAHGRGRKLVDYCLVNNAPIPQELIPIYAKENAQPIEIDLEEIAALAVTPHCAGVADVNQTRLARHDSDLLASAVLELMEQHTVRIKQQQGERWVREG